MKELINYIEQLCKRANPNYIFFHEEAQIFNIKGDGIKREDSFVFVEHLRSGSYVKERLGRKYKTYNVQIFFSKFADFANDLHRSPESTGMIRPNNVKNEEVLNTIEIEIVNPFVELLNDVNVRKALFNGKEWERINYGYPPTRFDSNEISVMIELTVYMPQC